MGERRYPIVGVLRIFQRNLDRLQMQSWNSLFTTTRMKRRRKKNISASLMLAVLFHVGTWEKEQKTTGSVFCGKPQKHLRNQHRSTVLENKHLLWVVQTPEQPKMFFYWFQKPRRCGGNVPSIIQTPVLHLLRSSLAACIPGGEPDYFCPARSELWLSRAWLKLTWNIS